MRNGSIGHPLLRSKRSGRNAPPFGSACIRLAQTYVAKNRYCQAKIVNAYGRPRTNHKRDYKLLISICLRGSFGFAEQIKPLLVEDWLKKLNLAPKSKSHLKNLMRVLFNAAMRWELIPYQHNPMSLVRVKDGSKRQREPKALSVDEFRKVLESIPEPFRTMCIVAMCLGLRVSEILGLRWRHIDWDGLRLAVRQAYV